MIEESKTMGLKVLILTDDLEGDDGFLLLALATTLFTLREGLKDGLGI